MSDRQGTNGIAGTDTDTGTGTGRASLGALFRQRALVDPDRPALIDGARVQSYAGLNARVNRLAHVLDGLGIRHGDRIAVLSGNAAEYVEIELAAAKIGAIVAAQNWRLADPELTHCIRLVAPAVAICTPTYREVLARLDIPDMPVIEIGEDYEARLAEAPEAEPDVPVDPEDGLIILYTSGTTGMPKGALISHRAMIARAMILGEIGVAPTDAFVAWAPFFHMASTDQALSTLLRGGTVISVDGYQPERLVEIVETHEIGWFLLMPGMVEEFNMALKAAGARPKGIKLIGAMADLVPPHAIAEATRLLDAPYLNTFGSTETGLPPATADLIPIGHVPTDLAKRQSAFCELRLVDPDENEVGIGAPGECCIRGATVFSGYWQAPETNGQDFRNGWFHMGDVFLRRPDGRLAFMDRVKYMIKSGGENIYPAEIERVLLADPRVDDAVVVRRTHPRWGEVPVAVIATGKPTEAAALQADLTGRCREVLAGYKQPREIRFVTFADLPRSTTGKVQRHLVEAWFRKD